MAASVAAQIAKRVAALEKSVSDVEQRKRLVQVGVAMKPLARQAAVADLGGDGAFSGWRRGAPIPLEVAFKMHCQGAAMTVHRSGKSAGMWTVAQKGRNQGNASGSMGPALPRFSKKTGKAIGRKSKRWNGTTDPKHTFSDAVKLMERKAPDLLVKLNRAATLRAFKEGR